MDMIYYADSDLQETNKVIAWKGCIARAMLNYFLLRWSFRPP